MKTISSNKSLIKWRQNINGSNISREDELILKDNYLNVFMQLQKFAEAKDPKTDFINAWHKICNDECKAVETKLASKCSDISSIERVVNKFRGNAGEIMAEKTFELFGTNWDIFPGSYDTVDPHHEMFIDAQALHIQDRLPIGIQVKNYAVHSKTHRNPVKWETFIKSMAMSTYWCADIKTVPIGKKDQFFSVPRQYIFSFTPPDFAKLTEDFHGSVRFIGPDELERKLDLKHKSYVFSQIIEEISVII